MKAEGALEKIITDFAFLSEAIRTNFKNALSQLQRGKAFSISQNSFVYFLGKQVRDYYQFSAYTKSSEKLVFYSTCANQRLKNVNFSENFVYALNKRSLLYMSLILHKKIFSEEVVLSSKYDKLIVIFALLKQNQGSQKHLGGGVKLLENFTACWRMMSDVMDDELQGKIVDMKLLFDFKNIFHANVKNSFTSYFEMLYFRNQQLHVQS